MNRRGTIGFDTLPCLKYIGSKASITAWQDKPEAPSPATSDEEDSGEDHDGGDDDKHDVGNDGGLGKIPSGNLT